MLRRTRVRRSTWAGVGLVMLYLSIIVLIPLAAVFWHAAQLGPAAFWEVVTTSDTLAALELSLGAALIVAVVNAIVGTVIAWVLVRDEFPGKTIVNAFIDLPFALPTIVAGLTLLALYGPKSPFGVNLAYTRGAVLLALLFVTLPFVVRSVQPVLMELERDAEEAASSLGARGFTVFRRIVLPSLLPADHLRGRPVVRPRHRRVRLGGADLRQHPVQDADRAGAHLRPRRERRLRRRRRGVRGPAAHLVRRAADPDAGPGLGKEDR